MFLSEVEVVDRVCLVHTLLTPLHQSILRCVSDRAGASSGETRTADKKAYPKGTAVHRAVQAHRHHGHRHPHAVLPDLVAADRPLRPDLALATPAHAAAVTVSRAPADPLDKAELLKEHLVAFYPKPTMLMVRTASPLRLGQSVTPPPKPHTPR